MRNSIIVVLMLMTVLPLTMAAGIVIQNRDLNIVDGNLVISGGIILATSGILKIDSNNTSVSGALDAQTLTANSISTDSAIISNSLVVGGTAAMHNILPGTGDWNIGSATQPWAWIFGKTIYAQNSICLAGTCITSWNDVNQNGGVAGGGTPNYLAKWGPTGEELNDSIIYDTGTRIGIDTNAPEYKLDVVGTIRGSALIVNKYGYSVRNSAGFITLPGPTSDYIITIQDGTGRIEHYWNASPGTSPTYLVSNEAAGKMLINPPGDPWFVLYWAPAGTAGTAISWQTKFSVYQDGSVAASSFKDLQNTAYYVNPAGTSQVVDINAVGSIATNHITDTTGTPRIEFNTTSGSVIVYVG